MNQKVTIRFLCKYSKIAMNNRYNVFYLLHCCWGTIIMFVQGIHPIILHWVLCPSPEHTSPVFLSWQLDCSCLWVPLEIVTVSFTSDAPLSVSLFIISIIIFELLKLSSLLHWSLYIDYKEDYFFSYRLNKIISLFIKIFGSNYMRLSQ